MNAACAADILDADALDRGSVHDMGVLPRSAVVMLTVATTFDIAGICLSSTNPCVLA